MTVIVKGRAELFRKARQDLMRPHPFAAERMGFFICRSSLANNSAKIIFAYDYLPLSDDEYIDDRSVGAMMGAGAIRRAMQIALTSGVSMFHVHLHSHRGKTWFSAIDLRESAKFVPDFFKVAPKIPHGVLVLSHDSAAGLCWSGDFPTPVVISNIAEIGAPIKIHRVEND